MKKKQPECAHLHVVQWVSVMLAVTFGIGNCCVDRLNTEGSSGSVMSVSGLIRVRTRKDYARRAILCLDIAYS